jgi:hypothetical protein
VKRLTVAFLIVAACASTVFAQSVEQQITDRHKVFLGWVGIVRTAEYKYKRQHDVFGTLAALRQARLPDTLVIESDDPYTHAFTETTPDSCLIPKNTSFQVTVSKDGQHYRVTIQEDVAHQTVTMFADETSTGLGDCRTRPQTYLRKIAQKDP